MASDARFPVILCALPAEAKPLRRHFGLMRDNRFAALPLYRSDRLALAITGVGPQAARTAINVLTASFVRRTPGRWINGGIVGHPTRDLGQWLEIERIVDAAGARPLRPALAQGVDLPRDGLVTSDAPCDDYAGSCCSDMEAWHLARSLQEQRPQDPFHCVKCVSDNRETGKVQISGKQVERWMEGILPAMELLAGVHRR